MPAEPKADELTLIFDMDGVIVDSNPFHKRAWQVFCEKIGCDLTEDDLRHYVYGKTNADALAYVFGGDLAPARARQLAADKERLYRELFAPTLKPIAGLAGFLETAVGSYHALAVATSAPPDNVDFVLDTLNLRRFFSRIVDETMVSHGKPNPEIYLKTAELLGVTPERCIVFEDSLAGIESARRAGMTVIGVTTTHGATELSDKADACIADFTALADNDAMLRAAVLERLGQSAHNSA